MKIKAIKDLSISELQQKNRDMDEELFRLRIRRTSGQLDSPALLRSVRRDIARIKTVLREREDR